MPPSRASSPSTANPPGRPVTRSQVPSDTAPEIVDATAHGLRAGMLNANVRYIIQRLQQSGHEAVIVGGAVRDLLQGRQPKDFDVATSAPPETVKRLFRNARIIGRRFRLVHLNYPDMTVEVATFRSKPRRGRDGMIHRDNTWGNLAEDAFRRDFTMNALSLDPQAMSIIDHVGGLADIAARRIRTILPPAASFEEDPVRMLRAVRFRVRLDFILDPALERCIREQAHGLDLVSRHRLAEETQRFVSGGYAQTVFAAFEELGLLVPLLDLEHHRKFFAPEARKRPLEVLSPFLARNDEVAAAGEEAAGPTVALLGLLLSLAQPDVRHGLFPQAPASVQAGAAPRRRRLHAATLADSFSAWGMLNGQVQPACQILETAYALLRDGPTPPGPEREPLRGEREAWMLLWLLRDGLGLPEEDLVPGRAALDDLPYLPILDHHIAAKHRTQARKAMQGPAHGLRRRKRRRRVRHKGGAREA